MKLFKKRSMLLLAIAALSCFSLFFMYKISQVSFIVQDEIIILQSNPIILKIPTIGVSTKIESLGLTKSGAVDSPVGPDKVAWFNLSPRPGENGNAIIDGHSGWKGNTPAVFDDLDKLKIGDKIYVQNGDNSEIIFIVRKIKIYKPGDDSSLVFGIGDGKSHLNLITCSGLWNARQKSSPDRLVVFTDRVI